MQLQDPTLLLAFGYAQKHALLDDIYDHLGVADTSTYLLAPESDEYKRKQKFQAEQQQKTQQAQQKQAQLAQAMQKQQMSMEVNEMQFKQWLEKSEDGREWMLAQVKSIESGMKNTDIGADNQREDEKMRWDKVTDLMEYDLEKTQERGAAI